MSKRHQASRRKTYGRRQHELRERRDRNDPQSADDLELDLDDRAVPAMVDRMAFLDAHAARFGYALGD
ncbi:MAG: hypothetical protein ACJ77N_01585 [Chloroflexota bacterium]